MNFLDLSCALLLLQFSLAFGNLQREFVTFDVANELKKSIKGYIFLRGSPDYETARPVHNGACRFIFPLLIVKPLNTEDVATTVRIASKYGIELSVRSGGHSYQCTGTKVISRIISRCCFKQVKFINKQLIVVNKQLNFVIDERHKHLNPYKTNS